MRQRRNPVMALPSGADNIEKLTSINLEIKNSPPSLHRIFIFCLVTRIINSLLVQTYFNPDEHWQAPEVAHRIAFGYGHLTWEWKKGIRSYLHPLLFAALYKVLGLFHLDISWFMIRAPRLLQSVFSAIGDLYLYKYSKALFGDNVAHWALFAQLTNWFMFFCITRTLSNSLETVLTVVSLYYWPCMRSSSCSVSSGSRKCALALAALACAVRPTSVITWIYIGILELFTTRDKLKFVLVEVFPIGVVLCELTNIIMSGATWNLDYDKVGSSNNFYGSYPLQLLSVYAIFPTHRGLVLGFTLLLDCHFYGSWVFVPLNFVKFNFLSSGGDYYGTHAWHWYITQGFTVMLFTHIPFSIAGIFMSKDWKLSGLTIWVLGVYSFLGHKEFRFVLPVLPVALIFSGFSLASIQQHGVSKRKSSKKLYTWLRMSIFSLLVTNLPMALYMSMVHQRGAEDAMNYLSREARHNRVESVLFLTPCHATPFYSTLHQNISMHFLDCTPSEERGILDESDQFLDNPLGFVTFFARNWTRPSHIVLFDSQEKLLKEFFLSHNFYEMKRFFHAHFKVDRELQRSVVVYSSQGQ